MRAQAQEATPEDLVPPPNPGTLMTDEERELLGLPLRGLVAADDKYPVEAEPHFLIEPPAPGRATPLGRAALVGSLCFCLLKWLLQLLGMLTLYWNSPTYTGAGIGGAYSQWTGWSMTPPEEFSLPFVVPG